MQRVAEVGNGAMTIAVSDLANDDPLVSRLGAASLVESTLASNAESKASDDGVWLVWLMLLPGLLLFRKNLVFVLLLFVLPAQQQVQAADASRFWNHAEHIAYEAYLRQDYKTAETMTANAWLQAASLYRQGRYQATLEYWDNADSALVQYNRGNSLALLQRHVEAVQAYQRAIELEPDFAEARYNLRLVELLLQQQDQVIAGAQSGDPNESNQASRSDDTTDMTIGQNELEGNPADEQNQGPGSGAAQLAGQIDPLTRFDGEDAAEQRFVLRAREAEQMPQSAFIDDWIDSLEETSTELYRRKFLRDYRQQRRQPK